MATKFKIKRGDTVVVISGKHKGATGRVLRLLPDEGRVLVENVNLVKRHVKATADQRGQTLQKEAPIHVSNVALWDAEAGRRVKAAWKVVDGEKVRVDRKTGAVINSGGA
jgi:large subunit ribosomal protein L24